MRLSIDSGDPGYPAWVGNPDARRARVFLDGIERTHVITADEERGFIERHCTDENGRVMLNSAGTETRREILGGVVFIMLPTADAA